MGLDYQELKTHLRLHVNSEMKQEATLPLGWRDKGKRVVVKTKGCLGIDLKPNRHRYH